MKDKNGTNIQTGDTVKAVWMDSVTGVSINGFTGIVQPDMTVKHVSPYSVKFHVLGPITREFTYEVIPQT